MPVQGQTSPRGGNFGLVGSFTSWLLALGGIALVLAA